MTDLITIEVLSETQPLNAIDAAVSWPEPFEMSPDRRVTSTERWLDSPTPRGWIDAVRCDLDAFLQDHAACERKASATAMTLASHYRDKEKLVSAMVELACEELDHFRQVYERIVARGGRLGDDSKDSYVRQLMQLAERGAETYLLDRLLIAGVIEARGSERFGLLARSLEPDLANFYGELARSEARHAGLFVGLAKAYFAPEQVKTRLAQLSLAEAEIMIALPFRPALH